MVSAVAAMQHHYRELRVPVVIMAGTKDRIVDHRKHTVRRHEEIAQSALRLARGLGRYSITPCPNKSSTRSKLLSVTQRRCAVQRARSARPRLRPWRPVLWGHEHGAGATSSLVQA